MHKWYLDDGALLGPVSLLESALSILGGGATWGRHDPQYEENNGLGAGTRTGVCNVGAK